MKRGAGAVALVFAGVFAAVGGLGWLLYSVGGSTTPSDTPIVSVKPPPDPGLLPERLVSPPPPVVNHPRVGQKLPPDAAPRFLIPGRDDLIHRNWKEVAKTFSDYQLLHAEMRDKGPPKPDDPKLSEKMIRIQDINQRFQITAAAPIIGIDAPPLATNHPTFVVNLVAGLLDLRRMPLTDDQAKRLLELALRAGPEIDRLDAAVTKASEPATNTEGVFYLAALADRGDAETRFFGEMLSILTDAQAASVSPIDVRGRSAGDIISGGLTWGRMLRVVPIADPEELTAFLVKDLGYRLSIPEDRLGELRGVVAPWVALRTTDTSDVQEKKGRVTGIRIAAEARRTIGLLRRVQEGIKLEPEQAAELLQVRMAYVVIPQ